MPRLTPVLGAVLVMCGALAACAADEQSAYGGDAAMSIAFDPALWADEPKVIAAPYPRNQMLSDVRRRVLMKGMTRDQVIALLGQPSKTEYFADHDMVYWLGPEPGLFGVDSQWLLIDFDSEGGLQSTEVATD